jgi:hypothetical protein
MASSYRQKLKKVSWLFLGWSCEVRWDRQACEWVGYGFYQRKGMCVEVRSGCREVAMATLRVEVCALAGGWDGGA